MHIAGNVYDSYNNDGILIHNYGPHTFHTNDKEVFDYVLQFTDWNYYNHRVVSYVDGNFVPMPISLETINKLYNMNLSEEENYHKHSPRYAFSFQLLILFYSSVMRYVQQWLTLQALHQQQ